MAITTHEIEDDVFKSLKKLELLSKAQDIVKNEYFAVLVMINFGCDYKSGHKVS